MYFLFKGSMDVLLKDFLILLKGERWRWGGGQKWNERKENKNKMNKT